jgi:hypothetical protein
MHEDKIALVAKQREDRALAAVIQLHAVQESGGFLGDLGSVE